MVNARVSLSFDIRVDGLDRGRLSFQSGLMPHIGASNRFLIVIHVADSAAQGNHDWLHVMPYRFLRAASLTFLRLWCDGLSLNPTKESCTWDHFIFIFLWILWCLHVYMLLIDESTWVEGGLAFDSLDGLQAYYSCLTRFSSDLYFRRIVHTEFVSRVVHTVVCILKLAEGVAGQWTRILDPAPDRVLFTTRCRLHAHPTHNRSHVLLLVDRGRLWTIHFKSVIQSGVERRQALVCHFICYLPILDNLCVLLSALRLHYDDPLLRLMHTQDHFLWIALAHLRIIFLRRETRHGLGCRDLRSGNFAINAAWCIGRDALLLIPSLVVVK